MEVRGATEDRPDVPEPAPLDLVRSRLAELVVHLSDCDPVAAVAAVRQAAPEGAPADHDGRLGIVAAALLRVRGGIDLREPAADAKPANDAKPATPAPA